MTSKTRYIESKIYLTKAAEHLAVAYWKDADEYHVKCAREEICKTLSEGGDYEVLLDLVEDAVNNTHDIDVTDRDYARNVVDALLDIAAPLLSEKRTPTNHDDYDEAAKEVGLL